MKIENRYFRSNYRSARALGFFAVAMLFILIGSASVSFGQARNHPGPKTVNPVRRIPLSELKKLRWIEGTWRGTGTETPPFFERYHFADDRTLVVESLAGGEADRVTEIKKFVWENGYFQNSDSGASLVARDLTANSIGFVPLYGKRTTYKWVRRSRDRWDKILAWPASGPADAAGQQVFHMERSIALRIGSDKH